METGASILSYTIGFLTATFAEPVRDFLLRPRIELAFESGKDFICDTPAAGAAGAFETTYFRCRVRNIESRLAKSCRAYLINVERKTAQGYFVPTIYGDSIQLAWSCMDDDGRFGPIDIPAGVDQFFDVLSVRERSTDMLPALKVLPFRYRALFGSQGTFRFTCLVAGDGVDPQRISLMLEWDGKFNSFKVFDERSAEISR